MTKDDGIPTRVLWARLRFQIIGPLLASPPEAGELGAKLAKQAYDILGGKPPQAEFMRTDAKDLRGSPVWEMDKWKEYT